MTDDEAALYYALQADDASSVRRLLEAGCDVNTTFYEVDPVTMSHWSALHMCCQKGSHRCAEVLLEAGADPDAWDKWKQTPLMYSCAVEWHNIMHQLLARGVDVNCGDIRARTAVHMAIKCSDTTALQMLIHASADLNLRNDKGATPLRNAVSRDGYAPMIKALVEAGCDVNIPDIQYSFTPLHACIALGGSDRLTYSKLILSAGDLDRSSLDPDDNTHVMAVISRAVKEGRELQVQESEMIRLFTHGRDDINVALVRALQKRENWLVKQLLSAGADANMRDADGKRALRLVAETGDIHLGLLLLQGGALLIPAMFYPYSPLEAAISNGDMKFVHFLFISGYDIRMDRRRSDQAKFKQVKRLSAEEERTLHDMAVSVPTLIILVRNYIREIMQQDIRSGVTRTNLPPSLKSFLLYE